MAREYFCAYHSLLESLTPYGDAEVGRLFRACLRYSMSGEEPALNGSERFIWPTLKVTIDRDRNAYEAACATNRENGLKGGRPKNRTVSQKTENNRTVISETEKTQEKEKEEEKEKDKEEKTREKRKRFTPPSVEEVRAYCQERGNNVDPQNFVDFYKSKGWRVGKDPMVDWRSSVRTWERRDAQDGKTRRATEKKTNNIFLEMLEEGSSE